ncbi:molybdopterin-containing oxidoreductase family protein [Desulforhabdus amnigena]|jgi:anaerobic selenocysteine-containing dehydrogenase|uniref:Dehydrogenase n=1 Tax=Desulforhabdus amnigena TaxID=40218 RepID=A0A9W6D4J2_9BACT|nr:molybdopterin-dependent oxidoreductase [Desulforhabdus amnigena]NLJ27683.1 molybdopterin-dependent oxidoreductase [Deltaproteobacteria bacterium]GLI33026.1 dehydrogenase [Desulforhabdus amnigena]
MSLVRESNCQLCGYFCGLRVSVDDNERVTRVRPDSARYPHDPSVIAQCRRFAANKEILDHPERLNHPLKRNGERGSGKWQRVTWEEAMADIASRLKDLKFRYGAETLASCISAPHTIYWPLHRFLNLWGTPNNVGIGTVCWNPRIWVNSLTYGWPLEDELDPSATRCVMLWGINPAESDRSLFWRTVKDYAASGGTLIVIDPRRTATARLTDRWLAVRPGTDGALALGILNVVIQEGLVDHGFVEHWCSGYAGLAQRVKEYTPQMVAGITGISASDIVESAVLYASSKPAAIFTGLGIDMSGIHCTQALRAIAALRAVTGNLDVPGASFINDRPDFVPEIELELSDRLPDSQRAKKLGAGLFRLQRYEGYERLTQFTMRHGKQLPARYLTSAHPHLLWQAMITGEPYPIRALICMASNPLLCQANTKLVYQALKSLDLLVVLEQFLTPTAMLADYVLPVTGSFEQPLMQTNGGVANIAYGGPAALAPRFERRTDFDFWNELGRRCGQEEYWPWNTLEETLTDVLAPAGMSWSDFCRTGFYAPEKEYRKWEKNGFATPSGKVELRSTLLEEFGHDPLPAYLPTNRADHEFPLALMTGARKHPYYASEFRQVKRIRRLHPRPVAEISLATADRFAIRPGDMIWIETRQGRIKQEATIAEMRDDLVSVEYGWWYPEKGAMEPGLGGLWESNANVLTAADTAFCDPILGQWDFRSIPCRIYKVEGVSDASVG